jgi:hypothetical protein
MKFIPDEDSLWKYCPTLVGTVVDYVNALGSEAWTYGVDSAFINERQAGVKFSRVASSGWGRDELWVSATQTEAGEAWVARSHTVTSDVR